MKMGMFQNRVVKKAIKPNYFITAIHKYVIINKIKWNYTNL
jgi:hypothetical protein